MQKILKNLPDTERFNGAVKATVISGLLRPIMILEDTPENTGPLIPLSIDYYAPAAAARLGLSVKNTIYILKEEGVGDDKYMMVDLPNLVTDPWGRTHAGGGEIKWKSLPKDYYEKITGILDTPTTRHLNHKRTFKMFNGSLCQHKITGYDGMNYYNENGEKINGRIDGWEWMNE